MHIVNIRLTHLKKADLNLLTYFAVLAEEGNISRAAKRLLLSQPAVSRALQRLRVMFGDDLLVRSTEGYELTPRGKTLWRELADILPKVDRLVAGSEFDPQVEAARFRISGTDYAVQVFSSVFCRQLSRWKRVVFDFKPWNDAVFDDLDHGRTDLLLTALGSPLPKHFRYEILYEEEVVCVVAKEYPLWDRISLEQFAAGSHLDVTLSTSHQSFLEKDLARLGFTRRNVFTVPYFSVALNAVASTELMATVPRRFAELLINPATTKILRLPEAICRYKYLMAWHPRLEADVQNLWLRQSIRSAAKELPPLPPDRRGSGSGRGRRGKPSDPR